MLLAAHQPTAIALTWTFYLMALHPEVDARLAAEVEQLGDRRATAEDLDRLVYTAAVCRRTDARVAPGPHSCIGVVRSRRP